MAGVTLNSCLLGGVAGSFTLRYHFGNSGGFGGIILSRRLAMTWACCAVGLLGIAWSAAAFCQTTSTPSESRHDAASGGAQPRVVETQWNLIELNGTAVNAPGAEGQVYIYLQQEGDKLSGSDGCNRFFGFYDLSGSSLEFHSVAQTLMACRGGFTEREAELIEALKLVASYQISDNALQLKVDDRVLARFQARKR
jgi:heat shock protein HslJ